MAIYMNMDNVPALIQLQNILFNILLNIFCVIWTKGLLIISTADILDSDIIIFTVSVIVTDNQKSRYKCRYSTSKINFSFKARQGMYCYKIVLNGFFTTFIQLALCLLQCIQAITTLIFIKSSLSPAYPLSVD